MDENIRRRLASIAARWNDIEGRMKEVEHFRREAILAAVNELRYTGRRLADVICVAIDETLDEAKIQKIDEDLIVAENYLNNADHDLTDAVVLYILLQVGDTIAYHGISKLRRLIPDYDTYIGVLEDAKRIVQGSRKDRAARKEAYARLAKEHVPKLMKLHDLISTNPEFYIPEIEVARGFQLVTNLSFAASVASIIGLLFAFWVWSITPSTADIKEMLDHTERAIISTRPSAHQ